MWTAFLYLAVILAPFLFPALFFRQSSEVESLTTGQASRIELIHYPSAESETDSDSQTDAQVNDSDHSQAQAERSSSFTFNPKTYLASAETPDFDYSDMPPLVSDSDEDSDRNEPVIRDLSWIRSHQAQIEARLNSYEDRLDSQESRLDSQESRLHSQEARLESQESRLHSQEAQLDSHEARLEFQGSRLNSYESWLASQEDRLESHTDRLNAQLSNDTEAEASYNDSTYPDATASQESPSHSQQANHSHNAASTNKVASHDIDDFETELD